jgi:nitrite reductase/ring-hydroxylating ferredoxin subunit
MVADLRDQPVTDYVSAEVLEAERVVLRSSPAVVGLSTDLADPGSYVAETVGGVNVLAVRQPDGTVAAFANACRHRGAKVVEDERGTGHAFACPYHGWTYGRDGALLAVPDDDGFVGLDRSCHGLRPLPCEERHGLVWVVADPEREPDDIDVAAHLGPADADLAVLGLDGHVTERIESVPAPGNWKLVVDGFLEVYHLRFLHALTIGPHIRTRPTVFDALGPHGRMCIARTRFGDRLDDDPADPSILADVVIVWQLFPATVVIWQADHFELWRIEAGRHPAESWSRVSLLAPREHVDEVELWDLNWKILMDTVREEDFRVARTMQENFASGAAPSLVFGRNEPALQHYHAEWDRALGR